MSLESARAYVDRMRNDETFRQSVNAFDGDESAWVFLKQHGFEFSMNEFKQVQAEIYEERGITPL